MKEEIVRTIERKKKKWTWICEPITCTSSSSWKRDSWGLIGMQQCVCGGITHGENTTDGFKDGT
jgi:hypothetical protein